MSHFTVLVTKTNKSSYENQLEPFDEQGEPEDYFMEFEVEIKKGEEKAYFERKVISWEKMRAKLVDDNKSFDNYTRYMNEAKELAEGSLEKMREKLADIYSEKDGDFGHWSNPNAQWDWYCVGGRWAGFFQTKKGSEGIRGDNGVLNQHYSENGVDIIKVKDIDWNAMDEIEKKNRSEYYDKEMKKSEANRFIFESNRKEMLKMTKDEFVNQPIHHETFAVLHEGEWYQKGNMGWFGLVTDEKGIETWKNEWKKLVQSLDPEDEVTLVDCHI